jgi:hypothetical protein
MAAKRELIPVGRIAQRILFLRGQKVILDSDLAALYDIETRALKQAVRRNRNRRITICDTKPPQVWRGCPNGIY